MDRNERDANACAERHYRELIAAFRGSPVAGVWYAFKDGSDTAHSLGSVRGDGDDQRGGEAESPCQQMNR